MHSQHIQITNLITLKCGFTVYRLSLITCLPVIYFSKRLVYLKCIKHRMLNKKHVVIYYE